MDGVLAREGDSLARSRVKLLVLRARASAAASHVLLSLALSLSLSSRALPFSLSSTDAARRERKRTPAGLQCDARSRSSLLARSLARCTHPSHKRPRRRAARPWSELRAHKQADTEPSQRRVLPLARREKERVKKGRTVKVDNHVAPDLAVLELRAVAHLDAVRNDAAVELDAAGHEREVRRRRRGVSVVHLTRSRSRGLERAREKGRERGGRTSRRRRRSPSGRSW